MWYPATVAAPATEPVTLDQVKLHLRIDHSDQDDLLATYIRAARATIEETCGARYGQRTGVVMRCDSFDDLAVLPEAPVTAVTSITYVDTEGATQTLATTVYEHRDNGLVQSIVLKYNQIWPSIQSGSRITVTGTVGYSTAPDPVQLAIMTRVAATYNVAEMPEDAADRLITSLLTNYRRYA